MKVKEHLRKGLKSSKREDIVASMLEEGHSLREIDSELTAIDRMEKAGYLGPLLYNRKVQIIITIVIFILFFSLYFVYYTSLDKIVINGHTYPLNKEVHFSIPDENVELKMNLSAKLYRHYKAERRSMTSETYKRLRSGNFTDEWYWNSLIASDEEDQIIDMFIVRLDGMITDGNLSYKGEDARVYYATKIVQSMTYDYLRYLGTNWKTRYPYETLYDQEGVCRETAPLLAKILSRMGYDVAIMSIGKINHVFVGIRCESPNAVKGYCIIETTAVTPIGGVEYKTRSWIPQDISEMHYKVYRVSDGKAFRFNYTTR